MYNQDNNSWQVCCEAALISDVSIKLIFVEMMGGLQRGKLLEIIQVKPLTVRIL